MFRKHPLASAISTALGTASTLLIAPATALAGEAGKIEEVVVTGSRIRGVGEIVSVEEVKGAIQSVVRVSVEIEGGGKPACVVDTISRYFMES